MNMLRRTRSQLTQLTKLGLISGLGCLCLAACDQQASQEPQPGAFALDHEDDNPAGANRLGTLSESLPELEPHELSLTDRTDFFSFRASQFGRTKLRVEKEHEAPLFLILWQLGPDGGRGPAVIDFWQVQASEDHEVNLAPGEYLLEVKNRTEHLVPYALGMALEGAKAQGAVPEPGDAPGASTDLGTIGEQALTLSGYVGIVDLVDAYRVQVSANTRLEVQGLSDAFDVALIDPNAKDGDSLPSTGTEPVGRRKKQWEVPEAGEYVLRVQSRSRPGALYELTLAAR